MVSRQFAGPSPRGTTPSEEQLFRDTGITVRGGSGAIIPGRRELAEQLKVEAAKKALVESAAKEKSAAIQRQKEEVQIRKAKTEQLVSAQKKLRERLKGIQTDQERVQLVKEFRGKVSGIEQGARGKSLEARFKEAGIEFPSRTTTTIEARQTGVTPEGIPIRQIIAVESTGRERLATKEESEIIREQERFIQKEKKPGFFQGLRQEAFTEEAKGKPSPIKGLVAAGGITAISTGQFIKQLTTQPITTVKESIKAIPKIPEQLGGLGAIIRSEPGFATGIVLSEAAILKSPKLLVKGTDIVRTSRLKELPGERIIAPEFSRGQTFPAIRKGQTAGELLEEFKPLLPGETKAAGFTASPKPFSKATEAGRGTSELPGVFQAPKVSPKFLRISGEEKKLFTLSPFETLRPSIVRITPEEIRLVPGLKKTQRVIQPGRVKEVREFFETAPKGKSFVPFIKTEKEAVIPFGTGLRQTQKRFFIKFEGRKIPIFEFETAPGGKKVLTPKGIIERKLPSVEDITSSLSERRIGGRGRLSSSEIASSSRLPRSASRSIASSISRARPIISSRASSVPSSSISRIGSRISPSAISRISRIRRVSSSSAASSIASSISIPRITSPGILPRPTKKKAKLKSRREKGRGRDDIAFVQGFTSKALELPKRIIKLSDIEKGLTEKAFGVRGAPIIVR